MNNTQTKAGRKLNDLTGMTYGRLTVINRAASKGRSTYYNCQCSCGNTCVKAARDLISGDTKSCGCLGSSKARSVECIDTGVIYSSMSAAARATGCNVSAIHSCCNGKLQSTGGFKWRYTSKAVNANTAQTNTGTFQTTPAGIMFTPATVKTQKITQVNPQIPATDDAAPVSQDTSKVAVYMPDELTNITITSAMTITNQIATIDTQIKELQIKKRDLQNQLITQKKDEIIQACIASDRSFDEIIELLRSDKKE
jgi:hypothetical protein